MSQQSEHSAAEPAAQDAVGRTGRRTLIGDVVSNKMTNTITVQVERTYKHTKYGKYVRRRKRYHAHTETPVAVGDTVEIMAARPMSALKRWRFVRVVKASADRGVDVETITESAKAAIAPKSEATGGDA